MRESLGTYETRRRSESKGHLPMAQVGSGAAVVAASAHYRPVSIVASMRRS